MRDTTSTSPRLATSSRSARGRLAWSALGALFAGLIAGCGADRALDSVDGAADWTLVRFHEEGVDGDLVVDPGGSLWLQDVRGGGESSARGLLAGERLETLVRLIGDLPLHSYSPQSSCPEGRFFVSVTRAGEVVTYASDECDGGAPLSVQPLRHMLSTVAAEFRAPRLDAAPFQILLRGTNSSYAQSQDRIAQNRDEYLRLLQSIDGRHPLVVPQVDFSRDVVVAHFLGERRSGGFDVSPELAERTENGWIRIGFLEQTPGPDCQVTEALTQPYVVVAVERPQKGLLFETRTQIVRCE